MLLLKTTPAVPGTFDGTITTWSPSLTPAVPSGAIMSVGWTWVSASGPIGPGDAPDIIQNSPAATGTGWNFTAVKAGDHTADITVVVEYYTEADGAGISPFS